MGINSPQTSSEILLKSFPEELGDVNSILYPMGLEWDVQNVHIGVIVSWVSTNLAQYSVYGRCTGLEIMAAKPYHWKI